MGDLVSKAIEERFTRLNRRILVALTVVAAIQAVVFVLLFAVFGSQPIGEWLPNLILATLFLMLLAALVLSAANSTRLKLLREANQYIGQELLELRSAGDRARSLQAMAATLSATLSFERVVEQALDVCSLALDEMGIPRESLVGAVFLYEDDVLQPIARRRFLGHDAEIAIPGTRGVIGAALSQAEPVVTNNPQDDPELMVYSAFGDCLTAVCIPLRAGFQIFGAMVIGTDIAVQFDRHHFELFEAVGDQAVIALQNAQLYQRLEAEKQRLIDADEQARKELARDLHDGPTQTIAALAMRINFVRGLIDQDPQRAKQEMEKIEALIKKTSADVRGVLYALRPLVLETQGLGAAVDSLLKRYSDVEGIEMRLIGAENGALLSKSAQTVVFPIVEEAFNNARKHAQASLIEIRFWRSDDLFVASVFDNGRGFDTYNVDRDYSTRGSLGMVNMRERAERIDGSLRVESTPETGTTVTLVVPLDKHGAEANGAAPDEELSETIQVG